MNTIEKYLTERPGDRGKPVPPNLKSSEWNSKFDDVEATLSGIATYFEEKGIKAVASLLDDAAMKVYKAKKSAQKVDFGRYL